MTAALVVALSLALGAVTGVAAVTPEPNTLGSRVQPNPINADEPEPIRVTNTSGGLSLDYTVTAPDGYAIEPATFSLPAAAVRTIELVAIGEGDGLITVSASPSAGQFPPGTLTSGLSLSVAVRHTGGFPLALIVAIVFALAFVVALIVVRRNIAGRRHRRERFERIFGTA